MFNRIGKQDEELSVCYARDTAAATCRFSVAGRRIQLVFILLLPFLCSGQGIWTQKAALPASSRGRAVAFTIGDKGYMGTGSSDGYGYSNLADFWEYDPGSDSWTQKADFGGGQRGFAAAFTIGNFGYVGSGRNALGYSTTDFWKYDPAANVWTPVAASPAQVVSSFSFALGGKGYVGTGGTDIYGASYSSFWEYDPVSDAWIAKGFYPGGSRLDVDRAVFTIGSKAYVGTGKDGAGNFLNDFWEYDQALNKWTQKANVPGPGRYGATGFSICGRGFLGLGCGGGYALGDYSMYDPSTDAWSAVPNFPGSQRWDLPSFVINDKAYIGTGEYVLMGSPAPANDFWVFSLPISPLITASKETVCTGSPVVLSVSGGLVYTWSTGDSVSTISVTPGTTTTYSATVSIYGCSEPVSKTINVIQSSTASFSYRYDPCTDACVSFLDQSTNALSMEWTFGDGETSHTYNPCHTFADSSTYSVTQKINDSSNCVSSLTLPVPFVIHQITDEIFVPTMFSPNGDGNNDVLRFYRHDNFCLKSFDIKIFDRWGELVFQTTDINDSWDGIYHGQKLETATFTYCYTVTVENGTHSMVKGTISLVR